MATTTDNYELILPTGEDRVNPLTQVNPNFETIDAQMKANANAGVGVANEIKTGTVHALTRITNDGDCAVFRFLATSDFHLGDSFTVDGVSVTALLPSGEVIGDGAYVIGSTVICVLVETRLTVYTSGGTATDSNALGGHPASYFLDASNEVFNNTGTNLSATNTEGAVKELNGKIDAITPITITQLTETTDGTGYASYPYPTGFTSSNTIFVDVKYSSDNKMHHGLTGNMGITTYSSVIQLGGAVPNTDHTITIIHY